MADLVGQRFGSLTVLQKAGVTSGRYKRAIWACRCDCGNEVEILSANIRRARQCSERCPTRWAATAGYEAAHQRVTVRRGRAAEHRCDCGKQAQEWAYDHADRNERLGASGGFLLAYSLDPQHYRPMCSACHRRYDQAHAKAVA